MDSDSDRTIDSDELEEIIAKSKKENKASARENRGTAASQRRQSFHDLSDTDSNEEEKPEIRQRPKPPKSLEKCKFGKNCYRKSPSHLKAFHNGDKREANDASEGQLKRKSSESLSAGKNVSNQSGSSYSNVESVKKPRKETAAHNKRPKCKYGKSCYRKNPIHLQEFDHEDDDEEEEDESESRVSPGNSQELPPSACLDYQFYLTKVSGINQKYNKLALGIKDILSFKDGTLISSCQFNYCFDIEWLMQQYPEKYRNLPLTIVHGEQRESKKNLERSGANFTNITFCQAKLDIPYGTHHTKMMFLLYKEGFRIVIHTSNIVDSDWFQRTQGMWVSPVLPELKSASVTEGESPTNFKADMLEYIASYGAQGLEKWSQVIKKHDFSKVRVVLVGSVPGRHLGSKKTSFGHLKLRKVLNLHSSPKETLRSDWPLVCQFSSIGSLGASPDQWLNAEFATSMSTTKNAPLTSQQCPLKLIYPTVENVRKSLQGYPAGASLPYSINVAKKQPYLKGYLHQWKSDKMGRTEASPHIKSYLRVSPDNSNIAWFLITSANLSKAAWGALEKKGAQLMIRSYELGVLFLPKFFGIEMFSTPSTKGEIKTIFPIPFDIPLAPYAKNDEPWIWDIPHIRAPDRHGQMWCPP